MKEPELPDPRWALALQHSHYLRQLFYARPELVERLRSAWEQPLSAAVLHDILAQEAGAAQITEEAAFNRQLRRLRQQAIAHLALRDLSGIASHAEVVESMTLLADVATCVALAFHTRRLAELHGMPRDRAGRAQPLLVIGMGKLGGRELNVSSDVDYIFVYPEDGETDGPRRIDNFEFFTRLGKRLIASLDERTGDGMVFRVDMRLRPNGDSGPLVSSFEALENYFITQGREWERYAWIKARIMCPAGPADGNPADGNPADGNPADGNPADGNPADGNPADGNCPADSNLPSVTAAQTEAWHIALEKIVEPFVFRKYLDFGAINAMRDLHAQIRREVARKDMAEHIKLGPGGIREIEFIAQVFQLIRGGRDPALRVRPTLTVLERLQERGILPESACRELRDAYLFLRKLEHRLQYREDKQTHMLPADAAERAQIAVSMSFPDWERLLARVNAHRAVVSAHFEAIFSAPEEGEHTCDDLWQEALETGEAEQRLAGLGFREAARSRECLHALRHSVRYRQLPARNRERLDAIGPRLIQLAAATAEPDLALARGLDFFEAIAGRGAYLALLQQYPQALRKVVDILVASSWAAEYLTRHPILLDELLDSRLLDAATDGQTFRQELEAQLAVVHGDTERELDVLRELHHAQVFRLLTQDLAGRHSLEQLSDQLSELADIILATTLSRCWEQIAARHRATPAFAIIGYGKLGGKELGYASDLDLVYLCDEHDEHPDAQRHYTRLGQRINTWLSSHTSAGILFETDLRLRPNGESGLLVPTLEAFRAYERDAAWTWEHQALTRARFVAGDPQLGARFEEARREILCRARDPETLKAEILAMRQKMLTHHANRDPDRFDLKNDPGGIIDVEFIVQYLILAHAREHPRLTANLGNIALLGLAAELGLIPESLSAPVRDAYRHYRRLQHQNRLNGSKRTLPRPPLEPEIQNVLALWRNVVLADGDGPAGGRRVP